MPDSLCRNYSELRFSLRFNHLVKGGILLTLLLFLAVGLSFVSGSVWLVSITITALVIKIYPTVLLLLAFMAVAFFVVKKYWR
jgi:hypothetical protein